jgi:hypothetical protein
MWYFMDLSKGATIDPSYVFRLLIPTKGPIEVTPLDVRHTGLSTVIFPKAKPGLYIRIFNFRALGEIPGLIEHCWAAQRRKW